MQTSKSVEFAATAITVMIFVGIVIWSISG
jgi:hypothetical protein